MLIFQSFYSSKNPERIYSTVLNIDNNNNNNNNKMFLEQQISILESEHCSNDAENLALITGINYILKLIQIESCYFK